MPLDPQARALLDQLKAANFPQLEKLSPVEARAASGMMAAAAPPGPEVGKVSDIQIPVRAGKIAARVYEPTGPAKGLIVYYHGGGWVVGTIDAMDAPCRVLVQRTGCRLISVDYRLAPEHPFPAAAEDAYDSFAWSATSEYGRGLPLIVAGDSAGGNLAAVVALMDRDAGKKRIALQVLFYPVTDYSFDTPSYSENADGYLLTRDAMKWFWGHYVQDEKLKRDPRHSPLQAKDLSGVAPAVVQTAEYDPLRDEGEAYGRRLAEAGVKTTVKRYPGIVHGYVGMAAVMSVAETAVSDAVAAIKAACTQPAHA